MKNILVVHGSPRGVESSESSLLANLFKDELLKKDPSVEVTEVVISDLPPFALTPSILAQSPTEDDLKRFPVRQQIVDQVVAADVIVLASPMWDYAMPGSVKEYLDAMCVAGTTFRYLEEPNEKGEVQEGLLTDKKMFFIQSMGGFHVDTPDDLGYALTKRIASFIGLDDFTYLPVEATNIAGKSTIEEAKSAVVAAVASL